MRAPPTRERIRGGCGTPVANPWHTRDVDNNEKPCDSYEKPCNNYEKLCNNHETQCNNYETPSNNNATQCK